MPARRALLAALLAAFLGGCALFGSGGAPVPLEVTVAAADRLNPDEQGQSLPTVVRVLQLKGTARLEGAEFDALYRRAKEVLAEDLLRVDELTVSPGQTVKLRLERDPAARAAVALCLFRRPAGLSWRAVAELPAPGKKAALTFAVDGYRIERR